MRISDWSSDVRSSDLPDHFVQAGIGLRHAHASTFDHHALGAQSLRLLAPAARAFREGDAAVAAQDAVPGQVRILVAAQDPRHQPRAARRSEEHTSELQSLMSISYAVFCLKKKKPNNT